MTYLLCSAVDDRDYGITHIVRGEDHVTNTAVQIQMMEALGCSALPHFSHLALMTTREGELSKRTGGLSLRSLRAEGMDPMAIASGLARLGTSDPVIPQCSMQAIVDGFEIGHFGRAPTLYDPEQCLQWNRKILALRSFEDAVVACKRLGIEGLTETLWYAIRHNIERWTEVPLWLTLLETDLPIAVLLEEREYLSEALVHLPETLDGESWSVWTKRLQGITGRRGRGLFLPLRRALTGREDGPEMATLLTILPRALVVARLTQAMGAA
jgi:glutamyl-tRNA synthetase